MPLCGTFNLIFLINIISCRLSACPSGDRANLFRSHAAKSVECAGASGHSSPRARRLPRESRRVSLAQACGYVQLNQYRLLEPIGQVASSYLLLLPTNDLPTASQTFIPDPV